MTHAAARGHQARPGPREAVGREGEGHEEERHQVEPESAGGAAGRGERLGRDLGGVEVERLAQPLHVADDGPVAGVELPRAEQRPQGLALGAAGGRRLRPVPVERRALLARRGELAVEGDRLRVVPRAGELVRLAEAVVRRGGDERRGERGRDEGERGGPHANLRTTAAARAARSLTLSEYSPSWGA